jgi:2-oxoglutarate decarboxylase
MIGAPIFHVNGDDPEACVWVARLAMDFRQQFKKDVIIDMLCYRRRGHNEGDDPSMTNPAMYDVIDTKRGVRKSYTEALIGRGDISIKEANSSRCSTRSGNWRSTSSSRASRSRRRR